MAYLYRPVPDPKVRGSRFRATSRHRGAVIVADIAVELAPVCKRCDCLRRPSDDLLEPCKVGRHGYAEVARHLVHRIVAGSEPVARKVPMPCESEVAHDAPVLVHESGCIFQLVDVARAHHTVALLPGRLFVVIALESASDALSRGADIAADPSPKPKPPAEPIFLLIYLFAVASSASLARCLRTPECTASGTFRSRRNCWCKALTALGDSRGKEEGPCC